MHLLMGFKGTVGILITESEMHEIIESALWRNKSENKKVQKHFSMFIEKDFKVHSHAIYFVRQSLYQTFSELHPLFSDKQMRFYVSLLCITYFYIV